MMSAAPQNIQYAAIRHMGPRRRVGGQAISNAILGRARIPHFHMAGAGSRGTLVRGVVVRDCGNHALVSHLSDGITFRDCIAYHVNEDAFFWDLGDPSNDILCIYCLAAGLTPIPSFRGYTLAGFVLGAGAGNVLRDSVAAGNAGNKRASGFEWPSKARDAGTWSFHDCIAHNNKATGIFAWQHGRAHSMIERFVAFRCGTGILHGAYANGFHYSDVMCFGSESAGLSVFAVSNGNPALSFSNVNVDGVVFERHAVPSGAAATFTDCTLRWVSVSEGAKYGGRYDFVRTDLEPDDWSVLSMDPQSVYRVQRRDGTAYRMDADGTSTAIPAFAS